MFGDVVDEGVVVVVVVGVFDVNGVDECVGVDWFGEVGYLMYVIGVVGVFEIWFEG